MPRHWCGPVPNARWCCTGRPSFHSPASSQRDSSWLADAVMTPTGEPARDRAARDLGVAGRDPADLRDRRLPPQRLLDHLGQQLAIGVDPLEHVGVREQCEEAVAHHAERRLRAGRQQQSQEAVDLRVGELLAVDLLVHEVGEEVAGGIRPRRASTSGRR